MRDSLVVALMAYAEASLRPKARRFLSGLSCDELQFIAGFFGGCILRSSGSDGPPNVVFPAAGPSRTASDLDHKLILVQEYLSCARLFGLPAISQPPGMKPLL